MITTNIDRQLPSIYHKTVVLQSYFSEPLGSSLVSFVDTISYLKNVDQIPGFPSCLCWGRLQNWVIYESTKSYPGFWGQYGWHWEKAVHNGGITFFTKKNQDCHWLACTPWPRGTQSKTQSHGLLHGLLAFQGPCGGQGGSRRGSLAVALTALTRHGAGSSPGGSRCNSHFFLTNFSFFFTFPPQNDEFPPMFGHCAWLQFFLASWDDERGDGNHPP